MNAPLRKVAIAVMVLFGLLFANLNYVQFYKGDYYRNHQKNTRVLVQEYQRQRGNIRVDRDAVALSEDTGGELRYTRKYPDGKKYAHVVGFKSIRYGDRGIERAYDSTLSGDDPRMFVRRVTDILTGRKPVGGDVTLTLSHRAQTKAYQELGNRKGAVVALDASTGAVLTAVSTPSYDPNPLASHDSDVAEKAWKDYNASPDKVMLNRALNQNYPPGSTFKTIVAAAALDSGYTPDTRIPAGPTYSPPQTTATIGNAHPSICPESQVTLAEAVRESCNTGFAKLGVELGADKIKETAQKFGFETDDLQIPLPVSESNTGEMPDPPSLAQSCIGQRDVRMTPLQGAMIAAAVNNGGEIMKPHLVEEVRAPDTAVLETAKAEEWRTPLSSDAADKLRGMMVGVVDSGTGTAAKIDGAEVGGKTGTAQNAEDANDHGWFIGFANQGNAKIAIAVVLERAGEGGSTEATRIGGSVMKTLLEERG